MSSTPEFALAAVAAPHPAAAAAGQVILAQGGNSIEATLAMAATLSVVAPHLMGPGGDGVWLIREPGGKVRCLEACGFAGARATPRFYLSAGHEKAPPAHGAPAALTAPGAVAGWAQALAFSRTGGGRLPLADILRDAIALARTGPAAPSAGPDLSAGLREAPGFAAAFLTEGEAARTGALRTGGAMADMLDHLAHAGLRDFHRGDVGREIAADLARIGAPVTRQDLMSMEARWRAPYSVRFAGASVFGAPPPSHGLAALMTIGLLARLRIDRAEMFDHMHGLVEAARRALAARDAECVDDDWRPHDPEERLAPQALEHEAARIGARARAHDHALFPRAGGAWLGAIDPSGLAVSCAHSLGGAWGSGCLLPSTGVLMGNAGRLFTLDGKSAHALAPGRRPMQALAPSLAAFSDGRIAVFGATGLDADPHTQALVFTRLAFGATPDAALKAPRVFFGALRAGGPARLHVEQGFDPTLVRMLERAGHDVQDTPASDADAFGHAGLLARARDGRLTGAHDPRVGGVAAGL